MTRHRVGDTGEFASSPFRVPRKGWWQVLRRTFVEIGNDRISLIAAGVAFYMFLALFPALGAMVILYGLVADPEEIRTHLATLKDAIPAEVYQVLLDRLSSLAGTTDGKLGLGLAGSLAFALWSATKGAKALLVAMNVAYEESDDRNIIWQNVVGLLFTLGAILFAIASLFLIAAVPVIANFISFGRTIDTAVLLVRWPVLACLILLAVCILYRWGANRSAPRVRWLFPGAILATVAWLLLSIGFSLYVQFFGSYEETFGSAAAIVVLLMWLYLSVFVVCIGAELNAELELQTERDSTAGLPRPKGTRGAFVADHRHEEVTR